MSGRWRSSCDIGRQNRHLGANLQIMGAEMRAGRSTWQTWRGMPLAAMLGQSVELGADVKGALRAFSDDMRDRRLSAG